MSTIFVAFPGLWLAVWVIGAILAIADENIREARYFVKLSLAGLVGGVVIDPVYSDFWQPPWWPWGSAIFGLSYLGVHTFFSSLWLSQVRWRQLPQPSLRTKGGVLLVVVGLWLIQWGWFGWNSVLATANSLLIGTVLMSLLPQHRAVWRAAWQGAVVSLYMYAVGVGGFLLVTAPFVDIDLLAATTSGYYARHGAWNTGALLTYWATIFGAFFGAIRPWWRGQSLA